VAGAALGWALSWLAPLERLLVGRQGMDQEVRSRAERAFLDHGLHQTAEGTGVLIFASLLEREAVVLGDHGIHARVGDAEWQATVAALVAGMKRGAPADGFVEAITRCGARLAEHFPRAGAPVANELPDALTLDRR
jgi:putative membrane protein